MLTPEQLKPHILHEDRWIRKAALDYFTESWSRDPEIAGLALTAHQRYFKLGEFPNLSQLDKLPIDAATAQRILALLDTTPSRVVAIHLNWCLGALPLAILRKEGKRIDDHPRLDDEARQKIRYRRNLGDLSDEALWKEFLKFSGREKLRKAPRRVDPIRTRAMVDELASRKSPDNESIGEMLQAPAFRGTHFEALLAKLAGVKRLKAVVPYLVTKLESDDDEDDPRGSAHQEALVRIGDPATVRLIRRRWRELEQKDAASVLGYIQSLESEEALIEFAKEDEDPEVQFFIADALCNLFSRDAVEPVRAVLREGSAYDMDEELQDKVLAVIDLLGIEVPEAEAWRKERQEKFAQMNSPEVVSAEALELHNKILGTVAEMDRADRDLQEAYQQLGERLAGSEDEEDEEDEEDDDDEEEDGKDRE